jgi:hypothetical protein
VGVTFHISLTWNFDHNSEEEREVVIHFLVGDVQLVEETIVSESKEYLTN